MLFFNQNPYFLLLLHHELFQLGIADNVCYCLKSILFVCMLNSDIYIMRDCHVIRIYTKRKDWPIDVHVNSL